MAYVHANVTSVVFKNGNHASQSKFPNSVFLPRFDVVGSASNAWRKELAPSSIALVPRATLAFDPSTTNADKTKPKKHTIDPASPDFLPLPSFEECFPKSTKESRYTLFSLNTYFSISMDFDYKSFDFLCLLLPNMLCARCY